MTTDLVELSRVKSDLEISALRIRAISQSYLRDKSLEAIGNAVYAVELLLEEERGKQGQ